jgi:hypothetical protein
MRTCVPTVTEFTDFTGVPAALLGHVTKHLSKFTTGTLRRVTTPIARCW